MKKEKTEAKKAEAEVKKAEAEKKKKEAEFKKAEAEKKKKEAAKKKEITELEQAMKKKAAEMKKEEKMERQKKKEMEEMAFFIKAVKNNREAQRRIGNEPELDTDEDIERCLKRESAKASMRFGIAGWFPPLGFVDNIALMKTQ